MYYYTNNYLKYPLLFATEMFEKINVTLWHIMAFFKEQLYILQFSLLQPFLTFHYPSN